MRTAVGALAVVAAASGASAFAPQSSFVGRATALRGAAIAPAQAQLAAPDLRSRDVSRKAISMDLDSWLVAAPGLVALGVTIQNQMSAGILSVRCISAMFVLCVAFALPFPRRRVVSLSFVQLAPLSLLAPPSLHRQRPRRLGSRCLTLPG